MDSVGLPVKVDTLGSGPAVRGLVITEPSRTKLKRKVGSCCSEGLRAHTQTHKLENSIIHSLKKIP